MSVRRSPPQSSTKWLLGVILAVAGVLRFSNEDWDGGYQLHPDERAILFVAQDIRLPDSLAEALDASRSGLSPFRAPDGSFRSFPYGHLPLYITVGIEKTITLACRATEVYARVSPDSFAGRLLNPAGLSSFDHLTYVGRAVSALFDTLTVLATGFLALELFKRWLSALLSCALIGFAVLHIQNAHFGTVDAPLAFFCTLAILAFVRYTSSRALRDSLVAGVAAGLAIGCKASGALLIIPMVAAHAGFRHPIPAFRDIHIPQIVSPRTFGLTLLAMACAFALTNPYALLDHGAFLNDLGVQTAIAVGGVEPPFALQYIGAWPVWYSIEQMTRWALGLPLALAAFAGLIWGARQSWVRRSHSLLVVVCWSTAAWIVLSSGSLKFPRYLMPITPSMIALAGGFLTVPQSLTPTARAALSAGVLLLTAASAVAFTGMYASPHPWLEASQWMYAHITPGSALLTEANDDALPLDLAARDGYHLRDSTYRTQRIDPLEEPDDCTKLRGIAEALAGSDYIVIASNRLYGVVPRLRMRFPLTAGYYDRLLTGGLGYSLERSWHRYPNLLGLAIVDNSFGVSTPISLSALGSPPVVLDIGAVDESFTVYDHPLVLLFKNRLRLDSAQLARAITGSALCTAP